VAADMLIGLAGRGDYTLDKRRTTGRRGEFRPEIEITPDVIAARISAYAPGRIGTGVFERYRPPEKQGACTKRIVGALVRMPPKPHEERKLRANRARVPGSARLWKSAAVKTETGI
jgi:hypothetical protein